MKKWIKAICKKTVMVETDKGDSLAFMEGEEYTRRNPEVWPDHKMTICLRDHQDENHFMDSQWFNEHFNKA